MSTEETEDSGTGSSSTTSVTTASKKRNVSETRIVLPARKKSKRKNQGQRSIFSPSNAATVTKTIGNAEIGPKSTDGTKKKWRCCTAEM